MTLSDDCVLRASGGGAAGVVGLGCGVNEMLSNSMADAKYGFTLLCVLGGGDGEREAVLDADRFAVSCSSSDADLEDSLPFFLFLCFFSLAALLGITSSSSDSTRPKALPM